MTSLKTVLLGSAAGILAVGAAQAADLPVKKAAAAVQYVEACPVYGSGFYKLPGTDICMRNFGSVKFGFAFQDARAQYDQGGILTVDKAVANTTGWQYSIRPGWDFRSPTEFGTLRTVVQLRVDQRNGVLQDSKPTLTGDQRTSSMIHRGYIEWAGFLIGRAGTQFAYWDQDDVVTAIGGDPKTTAMQFTYVWNFGGGLKATVGFEDSTAWMADKGVLGLGSAYKNLGPQRWAQDPVISLSTEQSWGNAKLAGAMHSLTVNNGSTGTKASTWGWAALAGITFNLPMLGAKDQLLLQGTVCEAAIAYCGINGGAENNATSFERKGQYLEGINRDDEDAYTTNVGTVVTFHKTKAWSIAGQLRHYWAPLWRTNISTSYHVINVPAAVEAATVANNGKGDAKVWDIAANLIWGQSRKTAEIGIEVAYKSVKQDLSTTVVLPAGVDKDPSGWAVAAFISRAW